MSRTPKRGKGPGFDYWTRRPYSADGHGPEIKKMTKKKERAQAKQKLVRVKKGKDDN